MPAIQFEIKFSTFSAKDRIHLLKVENISKAQAIQRAGRAGRDAEGKCFRLYSEQDYEKFEDMQKPELRRSSISSVYKFYAFRQKKFFVDCIGINRHGTQSSRTPRKFD